MHIGDWSQEPPATRTNSASTEADCSLLRWHHTQFIGRVKLNRSREFGVCFQPVPPTAPILRHGRPRPKTPPAPRAVAQRLHQKKRANKPLRQRFSPARLLTNAQCRQIEAKGSQQSRLARCQQESRMPSAKRKMLACRAARSSSSALDHFAVCTEPGGFLPANHLG